MDDKLLINALIIMAGIESKQSGAMPLEDNPLFVAANRLKELDALKAQVEKLKERNRKLDVDLLRALFYAPSSPVSAQKAQEIEVWYGKFKQVVLAAKAGE